MRKGHFLRTCTLLTALLLSQLCYPQVGRVPLLSELYPDMVAGRSSFARARTSSDALDGTFEIWRRVAISMGIGSIQDRAGNGCVYGTALEILSAMRAAATPVEYQRAWTENQSRVLQACSGTVEALTPYPDTAPARAVSDFQYQQASLHFHARQYRDALPLFREVAANTGAAVRPYAAYMVMRTLRQLGQVNEAYAEAGRILADPTLASVHPITDNYRFVLGYRNPGSIADAHLAWLLQIIETEPEEGVDPVRSMYDYEDAMAQLRLYFPLRDKDSRRIDWWLHDPAPNSPRARAVHALARSSEVVDWQQSIWAYNYLDHDWLWSLHEPEADYWNQNTAIVSHALERWDASARFDWMLITAKRVHPGAAEAERVLAHYDTLLLPSLSDETQQYQDAVAMLWLQTVRILLGQNRIAEATARLASPPLPVQSLRTPPPSYASVPMAYAPATEPQTMYLRALSLTLRWLIYTGQHTEARTLLTREEATAQQAGAGAHRSFLTDMRFYRGLLADSWQAYLDVVGGMPARNGQRNATLYDEALFNLLPTQDLADMAASETLLLPQHRAAFARAAFTRSALLGRKADILVHGRLAAALNFDERAELGTLLDSQRFDEIPDFLLAWPRFRLTPNISMTDGQYQYFKPQQRANTIDSYHHSDNNWWCSLDSESAVHTAINRLSIRPTENGRGSGRADNVERYLQVQADFMQQHPVFLRMDPQENALLAEQGNAPRYLASRVIDRHSVLRNLVSADFRERQALALHRVVRTTRYGCGRDGAHGEYSREAFRLLHRYYPDSVWAELTPYWFN